MIVLLVCLCLYECVCEQVDANSIHIHYEYDTISSVVMIIWYIKHNTILFSFHRNN